MVRILTRLMARLAVIATASCLAPAAARCAEFTAGNLFYTAASADVVVELTPSGTVVRSLGPFANFDEPSDLAFGPDGLLYVAARGSDRVVKIDGDGAVAGTLGTTTGLTEPVALAFAADGHLFVVSEDQSRVFEYDRLGALVRTIGAGSGLSQPRGVACTASGHVLVSSSATDLVLEFDASGTKLREIGAASTLDAPARLALAASGRLHVASQSSSEVLVFDAEGAVVDALGPGTALDAPIGSVCGPDGRLYVSDGADPRIVVFDAAGEPFATLTGLSQVASGVAVAPQRFLVTVAGSAEKFGLATVKVKETATLSVSPGSGFVQIDFVDDLATGLDVASLFASRTWAGYGFDVAQGSKARSMAATGVTGTSQATGIATFALKLTGKTSSLGAFRAKNVAGALEFARDGRAFVGTVKSKKALN